MFQFLPIEILPDNMLVCIASADSFHMGVLSSRAHGPWALRAGGWLGVGNDPRYSKSRVFDPFPFPDPPEALRSDIRLVAEELDAFRKARQAEHPGLTLTGMYNVLDKLKTGAALDANEERIGDEGLILILKELHERLDRLVLQAYGWPASLGDEEILARLVALNKERAAEERRGHVRWLRADYQIPRSGRPADRQGLRRKAPKSLRPFMFSTRRKSPHFRRAVSSRAPPSLRPSQPPRDRWMQPPSRRDSGRVAGSKAGSPQC